MHSSAMPSSRAAESQSAAGQKRRKLSRAALETITCITPLRRAIRKNVLPRCLAFAVEKPHAVHHVLLLRARQKWARRLQDSTRPHPHRKTAH